MIVSSDIIMSNETDITGKNIDFEEMGTMGIVRPEWCDCSIFNSSIAENWSESRHEYNGQQSKILNKTRFIRLLIYLTR